MTKFRIYAAAIILSIGATLFAGSLLYAAPKGGITPKEQACDNALIRCWRVCEGRNDEKSCSDGCVKRWSDCNGYAANQPPPRPLPDKPTWRKPGPTPPKGGVKEQ